MLKVLFAPVSIVGFVVGAMLGKRAFSAVWGAIDEEDPPKPTDRRVSWSKLLLASAVQGAVVRVVRSTVDQSAGRAFYRLTGSWPGDAQPEARP